MDTWAASYQFVLGGCRGSVCIFMATICCCLLIFGKCGGCGHHLWLVPRVCLGLARDGVSSWLLWCLVGPTGTVGFSKSPGDVEPSMGPLRDLVFMAHTAAPSSFVSPPMDTYRLLLVSPTLSSTTLLPFAPTPYANHFATRLTPPHPIARSSPDSTSAHQRDRRPSARLGLHHVRPDSR